MDKSIPVDTLPPLGRAQVWCDEACHQVTHQLEVVDEARPSQFDEAFSLWTPAAGDSPQSRVPTNKLRAHLYKAISTARAARSPTRLRPDLPCWKPHTGPGSTPAPTWRQKLLQGKAQRPLRRAFLLAWQGLFVTPPLHASLTGPPDAAFPNFTPCPQCQEAPAYPAHVFFECPAFAGLRSSFEHDVIRYVAPLLAPAWSTV